MPKPKKQETQKQYISRCVSDPEMESKYPDQEQRLTICYSYWRNRAK